jgi:hypothetical protein
VLRYGKHFNFSLELRATPVRQLLESQFFDGKLSLCPLIKSAVHQSLITRGNMLTRF